MITMNVSNLLPPHPLDGITIMIMEEMLGHCPPHHSRYLPLPGAPLLSTVHLVYSIQWRIQVWEFPLSHERGEA